MVVVEAVESYTAQTFGPQRDDLWSVRSDWHQLPVINGHVQEAGRDHGATAVTVIGAHSGARSVGLAAELAAAWPSRRGSSPGTARSSWTATPTR